jgi:hypothetical protein
LFDHIGIDVLSDREAVAVRAEGVQGEARRRVGVTLVYKDE